MKKNIYKLFQNSRSRSAAVLTAFAAVTGLILFRVFSERRMPADDLKKGISYIRQLEKTDTLPVEKEIKEIKKAERKAALENGELDVWQQFGDSVLLGDSRVVDFSYYGFLEENQVLAKVGATILDVPGYMNTLKDLNPSNIFLCFGINDISIEYWDTVGEYITELDKVIGKIHKTLPDSAVYVNSIIPVRDIPDESAKWREVPAWNEAIKQYCLEKEIPYIDLTETVKKHQDLYDADGLHMKSGFYTYWAIDMVTEINQYE